MLITNGCTGQKACENLPGVGTWLYVKSEVDASRNVTMMPGHIGRQTHMLVLVQTDLGLLFLLLSLWR